MPKKEWLGSLEVILLKKASYTAKIVPAWGGQVIALEKSSKNKERQIILNEPKTEDALREASSEYGLPVLFPPNRIDEGTFEAGGITYHFPINEPKTNNSLHGFVQDRPWKTDEITDNTIRMSFTIDESVEDIYRVFPVCCRIELYYELDLDGLHQTVTVTNLGSGVLPLGLGFHSAFAIDDKTTIRVSVKERVEMTERMLPSGTVASLGKERSLCEEEGLSPVAWSMDDHYMAGSLTVDQKPFHGAIIRRNGFEVRYEVDPFYRHWMIWNKEQTGDFICIEPQNWRVNAPNLVGTLKEAAGFDLIKPGEKVTARAHIWAE